MGWAPPHLPDDSPEVTDSKFRATVESIKKLETIEMSQNRERVKFIRVQHIVEYYENIQVMSSNNFNSMGKGS